MIHKKYVGLFFAGLCSVSLSFAQKDVTARLKSTAQAVLMSKIDKENAEIAEVLDSLNNHKSANSSAVYTNEDVQLVRQLRNAQKTVQLNYNDQVKFYIGKYTSANYKDYMSKMLGLSHYYFPIVENILTEMNIPSEIKYLSIVESSLNPHDVSTSGATGPWQFIYGTAKIYDLAMNNFIDERKDIVASSYAVAKYLKESYDQFGDWLFAIASYNCGRGAVKRAIQRSGLENPTFWQVSPLLPKETQNYIPKYIAMTYAMEYVDLYQIDPLLSELNCKTQLLHVDKFISLDGVASALNIPKGVLRSLNPSYKKGIVNGSVEEPRRLILPLNEDKIDNDKLYAALNTIVQQPQLNTQLSEESKVDTRVVANTERALKRNTVIPQTEKARVAYYTVKKGDTLSEIASKKGTTVTKLKRLNGLSTHQLKPGAKLRYD